MTFVPSIEQQAIFDAFLNTRGNLAIAALAGTGKTTTLVQLAKKLPSTGSKIYVAFNRDIVDDVQPKLDGTGMNAKTFHGLGYGALAKHLKVNRLEADDGKYKRLVQAWAEQSPLLIDTIVALVAEEKLENPEKRRKELIKGTVTMFTDLLRYMRLKLVEWDDIEGLRDLISYYRLDEEIDYYFELVDIVTQAVEPIMKQSETNLKTKIELDFTDMIYWVVRWDLRIYQYMYVFVDECQDLSPMQRAMIKKAIYERGGRIVLVGDVNQAIYAFAGADSDSFELSVKMFDAKVLPLSVTRRSDKIIVQHAQRRVSDFKALDTAQRGKIVWVDEGRLTALAQPGDMIISRVKAPLVAACIDFIMEGKPATILGNDIGKALIRIVERIKERDGFTWERVYDYLDAYQEEQVKKLEAKDDQAGIEAISDQCGAVRIVLEKSAATDFDAFSAYVDRLFSSKERDGVIILCTAHKSKGLEADRVFLISPDKLPLLFQDQSPEQRQQEYNLEYVAITRAKHTLVYLTNKKFLEKHVQPAYVQNTFDDVVVEQPAPTIVTVAELDDYEDDLHGEELEEIAALRPIPVGPTYVTSVIKQDQYDDDAEIIDFGAWEPIDVPEGDVFGIRNEPDEEDETVYASEQEPDFDLAPRAGDEEERILTFADYAIPAEDLHKPLVDLLADLDDDDDPETILHVVHKDGSLEPVELPSPSVLQRLRAFNLDIDDEPVHVEPDGTDMTYAIEARYGVAMGDDWMPVPVTPVMLEVEMPVYKPTGNLITDMKQFQLVKTQERLMLMIRDMSPAELERAARLLEKEFQSKPASTGAAQQPLL